MKFQIEHARFAHKGRVDEGSDLFKDLTVSISHGDCVAILGPEGSGKTTMLHLLAGLLAPDAGILLIDGINPHADPASGVTLHRRMGVTFQFPDEQFLRESVAEEFREVLTLRNVPSSEIVDRMEVSLASVGLNPKSFPERSPFTLSLGESRRVALALILASRPDAVIMDEPTAGLDASGISTTASALSKLRAAGVTIVMATHDIGFAAENTNRFVFLDRGTIVADGRTEAILSNSSLLEQYGFYVTQDQRERQRSLRIQ